MDMPERVLRVDFARLAVHSAMNQSDIAGGEAGRDLAQARFLCLGPAQHPATGCQIYWFCSPTGPGSVNSAPSGAWRP